MSEEFAAMVTPCIEECWAFVAARLTADQVGSPELAALVAQAPYLTTLDQGFSDPEEEIVSDYIFARHETDEPFQQVNYTDHRRHPPPRRRRCRRVAAQAGPPAEER